MNHPLTDEMIDSIAGLNKTYESDMRAAADWQLERDAEYFFEFMTTVLWWDPEIVQMRIEKFKKAMRPQEDNS